MCIIHSQNLSETYMYQILTTTTRQVHHVSHTSPYFKNLLQVSRSQHISDSKYICTKDKIFTHNIYRTLTSYTILTIHTGLIIETYHRLKTYTSHNKLPCKLTIYTISSQNMPRAQNKYWKFTECKLQIYHMKCTHKNIL